MKAEFLTVNNVGLTEIWNFLAANHKEGGDHFNHEMLTAYAKEAEFQVSEGNPPCIELRSWESISNTTIEFQISAAGIDSEMIEIDE